MTESEKRYRQKHKAEITKKITAWRKKKREENPEYRIADNEYHKNWKTKYRKNPEVREKERIYSAEYNESHREERNLLGRKLYNEKYAESLSIKLKTLRDKILDHYGRKCSCIGCDVTNEGFLSLDHVGGWKAVHPERKIRMAPLSFYKWIIDNNFPDTIRVRCMNCNWGMRHTGVCPHETEIDLAISDLLSSMKVGEEAVID